MLNKLFINGEWVDGDGPEFASVCPNNNEPTWLGKEASESQIDDAFDAARKALGSWWDQSDENRIKICERFAELIKESTDQLASIISSETGKPLWESNTEVGAVVGKIAVSISAYRERRSTTSFEMGEVTAVTRFKPHGVCAVLGPFNFPAHLPNGHIVPALIAGNTVVLKPSEQTPWTAQFMVEKWHEAGLPAGVLNMVHGAREVGVNIVGHREVDGLFFTGSDAAGKAIHRAFGDHPQKVLALEMGGNNPLVVDEISDVDAAAYLTVLSSFITAGQRCTCARRLLVVENEKTKLFLDSLIRIASDLKIGFFDDDSEPFTGTVISWAQGKAVLASQQELLDKGAKPLLTSSTLRNCDALLSPGLFDCTGLQLDDHEIFGPQLKLIRVPNLDTAIKEANNTKYGLSAALLSDNRDNYDQFIHQIRAGIVNWNRQTTGATGKLPFGGCGLSGNHRPAAYYAADYCSFPTASLESSELKLPEKLMTGVSVNQG